MKNKQSKKEFLTVSSQSIITLFAGMIVIIAQLSYIAFDVLFGNHANDLYTLALYRKCIEYIFVETVIVIIGAFLFDITVRDCKRKE